MSKKAVKKAPPVVSAPTEKKEVPAEKKEAPAAVATAKPEKKYSDILVEKVADGNYAVISINRPDKLNALDAAMVEGIVAAGEQVGADPSVLGKTISVNGMPLEIVGVAPRGFTSTTLGAMPKVFVPMTHWCSAIPPTPIGLARSWSGPAP